MKFLVLTSLPDVPMYEGLIIDYKVTPLLGIAMKWQTKITQVDTHKSFTDFQQKGPYKLWNHFHEFIPNEEGVLMKDTIDYELPFGILGDVTNACIVRSKLTHIFDYRRQVLEKLFHAVE